jgi:hypothetical protein
MPMPYTLTRGPLLTLLENVLNPHDAAEEAARDAVLDALRHDVPLGDLVRNFLQPTQGVAIPQAPLDVRLEQDWIGNGASGPPGEATGYWVGYQGDVEGVLREGLIRTIEVSLGLARHAEPAHATRSWPVQVHWKCPNPYFEVWVAWREHDDTARGGQVDVVIATPPDKANRLTTRPLFPPAPPAGEAAVPTPLGDPTARPETDATATVGMWLVTHERHRLGLSDERIAVAGGVRLGFETERGMTGGLVGLPEGEWLVPTPSTFWVDEGDVVVVAPPSYAGGADPGRSNAP